MTEPHHSDLTRAIQAALKLSQNRDLEVPRVDREGLENVLREAFREPGNDDGAKAWTTVADAAIAYMGAQPVDGDVTKLREEVATWKACATDADGRSRAQYAACAKERDEQRARAERLESELAEARRQPAQGGLPEVGESGYEVKDMEGKWEEATVESVGDGHVELRGKSGYSRLRRLSDEEKQWRRVPQPKPAVATNEKNRSDR